MAGKNSLLQLIRDGRPMNMRQQLHLVVQLSLPAIMAQVSSIVMQYIDASMVGHLGANESAAIGLVSTSTWLFWGLCTAAATGFSVQVAHRIGANDAAGAKSVLRQSVVSVLIFSLLLTAVGVSISGVLPKWLGGDSAINGDASRYFAIFIMSLPVLQMNFLAGGMLRCSGNMKIPSVLNVLMCVLDVLFNFLLIFPTRRIDLFGYVLTMPGAGWGVTGAAVGTALAELVVALLMMWFLFFRSEELSLSGVYGSFRPTGSCLKRAIQIGLPMGCEHVVICSAQIITTAIVAPLGIVAIAANSFAVTAESLCYMPGYGVGEAATTLIGQSLGAKREDLTRRFAYTTVFFGMAIMTLMGVVMFIFAPFMMEVMTPDTDISSLGASILRIEAFAEPMFAASIVAYGVFIGAGDTLKPFLMNFGSIWCVRLTLAALLAPTMGLKGVWVAMCVELCFRGLIFLVRLRFGKWMKFI